MAIVLDHEEVLGHTALSSLPTGDDLEVGLRRGREVDVFRQGHPDRLGRVLVRQAVIGEAKLVRASAATAIPRPRRRDRMDRSAMVNIDVCSSLSVEASLALLERCRYRSRSSSAAVEPFPSSSFASRPPVWLSLPDRLRRRGQDSAIVSLGTAVRQGRVPRAIRSQTVTRPRSGRSGCHGLNSRPGPRIGGQRVPVEVYEHLLEVLACPAIPPGIGPARCPNRAVQSEHAYNVRHGRHLPRASRRE